MAWRIELAGYRELMAELDRIDDRLSRRTARECAKAAGEVIARRAKQLCPVGDPAHNSAAKPLRDTIAVEMRDYDSKVLAVIGPQYPAGAHGHLVEYGHQEVLWGVRTGRRVAPRPFLRPAYDETQEEQQAAMQSVVDATLREIGA